MTIDCVTGNSGAIGDGVTNFMAGCVSDNTTWNILVREIQGNETKELRFEDAQEMSWFVCRVPGYVGLGRK